MISELLQWDQEFFFLVNQYGQHVWLDMILPLLRNKYFWAPLYLFIIVFLVMNYKWKAFWVLLFLGVTVTLCDQMSSHFFKPTIERLRPCHDPAIKDQVRLLTDCGGKFSFTSSHATNHFGVALFLVCFFWKRYKWLLPVGLLWAGAISYAQIYVGVHYPLDVIAGALLGTSLGLLSYLLYKITYISIQKRFNH